MSRLSQAFASKQKIAKADTDKIAKAIPANTVLLEFAKADMFNFKAKGKEKKWELPHSLAFVLHSGQANNVSMETAASAPTVETTAKNRSADMRGLKFDRLPGTLAEVTNISSLMGKNNVSLYTEKQAFEDVLMKTGTPGILHLATHGFFLSDQDLSDLMKEDETGGLRAIRPVQKPSAVPVRYENPLLRSGIALAGANNALIKEGKSQGIVTADKILGLKLRCTDMTVLSACETGL